MLATMTTTPVRVSIAQCALDRATAIAGSELRALYSSSAIDRAVGRRDLVRILPDVYASPVHARSFEVRARAANLWALAPVSGLSALFLWGLIDKPPETIEVLVPHGRKLRAQAGFTVTRCSVAIPQSSRHGVSTVNPAAAIVIGYGQVPSGNRADVVYRAVRRGLVGSDQLQAMVETVPRVRARAPLERTIAAAAAGAQSWLEEHALYNVFNTAEFSHFLRQHEVVIEGNQYFLDMFDPVTKTAVELDGREGHIDAGRQRNIERDNWVASMGILTLRFSYEDLVKRPEWCRRMVREALRRRAQRG